MAAARPKLIFGAAQGVPKISLATNSEVQEYSVLGEDQTGDLTLLARLPPSSEKAKLPLSQPRLQSEEQTKKVAAVIKVPPGPDPTINTEADSALDDAIGIPQPQINPNEPSKYGDESLQKIANEIREEDTENPYAQQTTIYPLQSRLGFQKQILKVFSSFIKIPEFGKEPDFDACKKIGAGAQQQVEMYEYQKFVREYVKQATPYRGLLVYHGLGSGKTCSAIAAAEALFSVSNKKIIVMTPSSLRYNFIREVSFCGFRHFRYQNHWVKLDATEPTIRLFAKEILSLPDSFFRKTKTLWVPDFSQESNFKSLDDESRKQIVAQLETQITNRIQFVNYNGITSSHLKEIACAPLDEEGNGFFDNAVIVVDEIHNLTRLMQGTIEPYLTALPGLKRKVPLEPVTPGHWTPELCKKTTDPRRPYLTNYKRGFLLYRLLAGARNSKIIGLSGTPLINFPEEIAILTNLLGGYIHTSSFTISPSSEENRTKIRALLTENRFVDFEDIELLGVSMKVIFTLLPEGMEKVTDPQGVLGVQRVAPGVQTPTIQEVTTGLLGKLSAANMRLIGTPEFKSEPLLPPIGEEFREKFLDADGTTLKNTVVLRKRLQGLISYYRGSKKELMPTVTVDEVIKVPFSPYSQAEYQRIRGEELKQQLEKKKDQQAVQGVTGKMANLWADIYELTKLKQPNSYRMASRQACNFTFPEGIVRPRPRDSQDIQAEVGNEKDDIIEAELDQEVKGEVTDSAASAAAASAAAAAEDAAIDDGAKAEAVAEAREAGQEKEAEQIAKEDEPILIAEAPAIPGAPIPAVEPKAEAPQAKKTLTGAQLIMQQQAKKKEECKKGILPGEKYEVATRRSKECLKLFASQKLRLFAPGKKLQDEVKAGSEPDPERLAKYSPKYATILKKILEAPGSSLIYSQFLDMEGIGIFTTVLEINDFHRIDIRADETGTMRFSDLTIANLKKGPGVNRYLSFTGGEAPALRNMALKVFNSKFSDNTFTELPPEMSQVLVEAGYTGNLVGNLCRVFCITSAGAEGLSLRNVRRVHIMEPFWNHVRTDQVKGRAVRICSHIDLDYSADPLLNQRTVEVYTYCSVFDSQALIKPDGSAGFPRIDQTILNGDGVKPREAEKLGFTVPPGATDYVITSDEYLHQISQRKKKVLQNIQDLMKTNAVDCQINQYENEEEGLACITLPGTPQQYAFHPNLMKDIAETSTKFRDADLKPVAPLPSAEVEEARAVFASADADAGKAQGQKQATPLTQAPVAKQLQPQVQPKPTLRAYEIIVNKVPYLAVPVLPKGQSIPFIFDLYSRGDIRRTKKIGRSIADSRGNPTSDIELF
uniref:Helicase ATP-binding domain-containing protein n=1 Tax=viral metagenome TaxID=1070528 RepID=A0A6C0KN46_9ZZZZ